MKTQTQEEEEDEYEQLQIIKEVHGPINGHIGIHKTIGLLSKRHKWKGMNTDEDKYRRKCAQCQLVNHMQANKKTFSLRKWHFQE